MRGYRYWSTVTIWACVLLIVLIAGIVHIDRVCGQRIDQIAKQQTDTLDQIMELRRDIDAIEQTQAPTLSDEDLDLITRVVMAEARGTGFEGMSAVAQVIKDRSDLWGMSPREVVTASAQFAKPYQGEISETARWAVKAVFDYDYRIIADPVTHFASGSDPYWTDNKLSRGMIGGNRFWY